MTLTDRTLVPQIVFGQHALNIPHIDSGALFGGELCVGCATLLLPFDGDADGRIVQPARSSADLPQRLPRGLAMPLPSNTSRPMPTQLLKVETALLSPSELDWSSPR
jgi:hypothetical protein